MRRIVRREVQGGNPFVVRLRPRLAGRPRGGSALEVLPVPRVRGRGQGVPPRAPARGSPADHE